MRRPLAIYSAIVAVSVAAAVNPFTIKFLLGLPIAWIIYSAVLDLYAAAVVGSAIFALKSQRRAAFALLPSALVAAVPFLSAAELAIGHVQYLTEIRRSDRAASDDGRMFRPDPTLGWSLARNVVVRQVSRGNFDASYRLDPLGRKAIPQNPSAPATLHVFGDSIVFGLGASNEDTALNVLARRINGVMNVQNYAVPAYGLEQMSLRLQQAIDEIKPGDLVLFAPISEDVRRNFIHRAYPCALHYANATELQVPKRVGNDWILAKTSDECNFVTDYLLRRSHLPLGLIYKAYYDWSIAAALARNADALFTAARELVERRGARFDLIVVARPFECARRRYDADWTGVRTRYRSLLVDCPRDPVAVERLSFPTDGHLSIEGNAWLARSIENFLREGKYFP